MPASSRGCPARWWPPSAALVSCRPAAGALLLPAPLSAPRPHWRRARPAHLSSASLPRQPHTQRPTLASIRRRPICTSYNTTCTWATRPASTRPACWTSESQRGSAHPACQCSLDAWCKPHCGPAAARFRRRCPCMQMGCRRRCQPRRPAGARTTAPPAAAHNPTIALQIL